MTQKRAHKAICDNLRARADSHVGYLLSGSRIDFSCVWSCAIDLEIPGELPPNTSDRGL